MLIETNLTFSNEGGGGGLKTSLFLPPNNKSNYSNLKKRNGEEREVRKEYANPDVK